ncbi:hypothetical protein HMPREF3156_00624 [Neisseria sp. HMSC06F02]|nr:hypothetical protein HMPREF3156_00624 [Neisseria sp. HMSC06F02]
MPVRFRIGCGRYFRRPENIFVESRSDLLCYEFILFSKDRT